MPSTVHCRGVSVAALPCVEKDGFVWVWPGDAEPGEVPGTTAPPPGFVVHAEIALDVPVEHGAAGRQVAGPRRAVRPAPLARGEAGRRPAAGGRGSTQDRTQPASQGTLESTHPSLPPSPPKPAPQV
jgi:hypothetical protein